MVPLADNHFVIEAKPEDAMTNLRRHRSLGPAWPAWCSTNSARQGARFGNRVRWCAIRRSWRIMPTKGVTVRAADYDAPETLAAALAGVDRLLLISGNTLGERPRQHAAVIDAAKAAGVGYLAYTSILHADRSPIRLGEEHRATEAALAASGLTLRSAAQRLVQRELHPCR